MLSPCFSTLNRSSDAENICKRWLESPLFYGSLESLEQPVSSPLNDLEKGFLEELAAASDMSLSFLRTVRMSALSAAELQFVAQHPSGWLDKAELVIIAALIKHHGLVGSKKKKNKKHQM
jgi:hypothetical protein